MRTITGVSTSIAVFIGRAKWGPVNEPVLCFSYSDCERVFTSDTSQGDLLHTLRLFFLNGGAQCYIIRLAKVSKENIAIVTVPNAFTAIAKYPGEFGNSIRLTIDYPTQKSNKIFNMKIFRIMNIAGIDVEHDVEYWKGLSMDASDPGYAITIVKSNLIILNKHGNKRPDQVSFKLAGGGEGMILTDQEYLNAYHKILTEVDIFNLLVLAKNKGPLSIPILSQLSEASNFCKKRRALLLIDPLEQWKTPSEVLSMTSGIKSIQSTIVKSNCAIFFPRLMIGENSESIFIGPGGAIAGLMARIDSTRGVWKSPAGNDANIIGILGVEYNLTDSENQILNPRGINSIRVFPSRICNWGGRTLDGDDNFASEWKYIVVRRTFLFIEESLYRGLKWIVSEPNDERLWAEILLNVNAFMFNLFRQGAFMGSTVHQAYFVKCDRETTTQNDINLGLVNILVGFAPLKPAEFVIVRIQQIVGKIHL